jgi:lethal(2) giant larvae protein
MHLLAHILLPYPQQLESLCWGRGGETIISSHSDGSYAVWSTDTGSRLTMQPTVATTPYGEYWGGQS